MDNKSIALEYLSKIPSTNIKRQNDKFINIRCPICGDSKNKYKARGYILLDKDAPIYYCHNDSCVATGGISFNKFLSEIEPRLADEYTSSMKKEHVKGFKSRNADYKRQQELFGSNTNTNLNDLEQREVPQNEDKHTLSDTIEEYSLLNPKLVYFDRLEFNYTDPETNQIISEYKSISLLNEEAKEYLYSRGFLDEDINDLLYSPETNSIVLPWWYNKGKGLVYGFQTRSIESKYFYIQNYEVNPKVWNLYDMLELPDGSEVYVFESIFDAKSNSIENKIATLGRELPKDIIDLFKERGIELIFCVDNDEAGKSTAIKYSKLGFKVLVHPKEMPLKDTNAMLSYGFTKDMIAEYITTNVYYPKKAQFKLRLDK